MNTHADLNNAVDHQPDFAAVFTMEQVNELEQDDPHGISRRITLVTLTKSKAELVKMIQEGDAEVFEQITGEIKSFQEHLESMKEAADTAFARLMLAAYEIINASDKGHATQVPEVHHD